MGVCILAEAFKKKKRSKPLLNLRGLFYSNFLIDKDTKPPGLVQDGKLVHWRETYTL